MIDLDQTDGNKTDVTSSTVIPLLTKLFYLLELVTLKSKSNVKGTI